MLAHDEAEPVPARMAPDRSSDACRLPMLAPGSDPGREVRLVNFAWRFSTTSR